MNVPESAPACSASRLEGCADFPGGSGNRKSGHSHQPTAPAPPFVCAAKDDCVSLGLLRAMS